MSFWPRWRWSAFNFDNLFEFRFLICVIISLQIIIPRWWHFCCWIIIWIIVITLRNKIIYEDPNSISHQIIHLELKLFSCRPFWFGLFCHVGSARLVVLYLVDSILELKTVKEMGSRNKRVLLSGMRRLDWKYFWSEWGCLRSGIEFSG